MIKLNFNKEIWRDLWGYENIYLISTYGNLKNKITGNVKKTQLDKDGYLRVSLWKKGLGKRFGIHQLVANTFLLKSHNENVVNHKDGNKRNNNIHNLEWTTFRGNEEHATKRGLKAKGEQNGWSKLKTHQVLNIRKMYLLGYTYSAIARQFMLSVNHVSRIVRKESWKHI